MEWVHDIHGVKAIGYSGTALNRKQIESLPSLAPTRRSNLLQITCQKQAFPCLLYSKRGTGARRRQIDPNSRQQIAAAGFHRGKYVWATSIHSGSRMQCQWCFASGSRELHRMTHFNKLQVPTPDFPWEWGVGCGEMDIFMLTVVYVLTRYITYLNLLYFDSMERER